MSGRLSSVYFIPGFLFLFLNTFTSHVFYHVNSFKIFLLGVTTTLLFVVFLLFKNISTKDAENNSFQLLSGKVFLLSYPILLTIPGAVLHGLNYNYNFLYELVSFLFLFLWSILLFVSLKSDEDIEKLIFWFALVVIYSASWGILEYLGSHPMLAGYPQERIRSTFGHFNYYAGFLVIIIPFIFIKALPDFFNSDLEFSKRFSSYNKFYSITFLFSLVALYFTQTRAAVFAINISVILASIVFAVQFLEEKGRKLFFVTLIALFTLALVLFFAFLSNLIVIPEEYLKSRYLSIFSFSTWAGRISAWKAAIGAISDSPLFGYGLGSSYNLYFKYVSPDSRIYTFERSFNHAHSEILEFIEEAGLIGFVLFLVFWAWFYKNIVKLMLKGESPFIKSLAYAIFIGISSYHLHSIFSVAQRMIVVRFPMFSIAAIGIFLIQRSSSQEIPFFNILKRKYNQNIKVSQYGLFTLILVAWVMYYPWMKGQYEFANIHRERSSYSNVRKLEELTESRYDIYALDFLAIQQLNYKRFNQLDKTLERISETIEDFRQTGFLHAYKSYFEGQDLENTKMLAKKYQDYDNFHLNNNQLLVKIALLKNDFSSFKEEIKRILFFHIFEIVKRDLQENPFKQYDKDALRINFSSQQATQVVEEPNTLIISFSEKFIATIFKLLRTAIARDAEVQKQLYAILTNELNQVRYFNINLPQDPMRTQLITQHLSQYFKLQDEMKKQEESLNSQKQRSYRYGMSKFERGRISYEFDQRINQKREEIRQRSQVHVDYLSQHTDWQKYLQKRRIAEAVLKSFLEVKAFVTN